MKNAIILHGKEDRDVYFDPNQPPSSDNHWLPWLQKQLLIAGINAQTPEISNSYQPDYHTWRQEFERYDLTPETILVGHSCGGGFLLRWLSEHPQQRVGKVILVAPWIDPNGELDQDNTFFDFKLDPQLAGRTQEIIIFNSDDDNSSIHETIKKVTSIIAPVRLREFHNYGHFCLEDMKTTAFPELLEEALSTTGTSTPQI